MKSSEFIGEVFHSYYERNLSSIVSPKTAEQREFGFNVNKHGMIRHKRFRNRDELLAFMRNMAPFDTYYSCAYYVDPEAEMGRKGWIGADLVFDIDADHIPTTCGKIHDEWTCGACGLVGTGITPDACPTCHGQKFEVKTWPCEECLDSAKTETMKLLNMLRMDFGLSQDETHVFFSGHRGYHIHVENEVVMNLDSLARKEIVDYVCGTGLDTGFGKSPAKNAGKQHLPSSPRLGDLGWRGRLAAGMRDFILKGEADDYKNIGLRQDDFEAIRKNEDTLLRNWNGVGPYQATKDIGFEKWRKIVESRVEILSAKIDTVVTTDIHRLIRLAGALHGKTGLRKVECSISNIQAFDPFKSAVAFKEGTATVSVSNVPRFRLGEETFGPFKDQKVELPTAAAVLITCRRRGEVVEYDVR